MKPTRAQVIAAVTTLLAALGLSQLLTTGDLSHDLTPNASDGTVDSEYPDGDKPPGGVTLSWDLLGFPTLTGLLTGTPVSHNDCQYLSGTGAAAASIAVVNVSGDDAATEGWAEASCLLTHPGDNTGSGVFKLRATNGAITADSANISWAYTAPVTADWDWAETDGLDNGAVSGGGDWVTFGGATLNADPDTDNYLQITHANDGWAGISSGSGEPVFVSGATYSVSITIDAGGSSDEIWVQIGLGTAVEFAGTGAIAHDVTVGVGTPNIVFHGNGQAVNDATTRITAMSATGVGDSFNFASATYSVNETAGTLEIGVTRSNPSAATATIDVTRTAGTDAVATVTDAELSWAVSEGGTKFATLDVNGDGEVTIGISNPSVGVLGTVTATVVTVNPAASGSTDFPRLGMNWIGGSTDLGSQTTMYQSAQGIENMRRRHLVIMGQWPELQSATGVTHQSVAAAVKAASTIGTRLFIYMDQDSVYKASYTSAYATKRAKMTAEGWYLYATGASGATVDSYFGNNRTTINVTSFAPADSSGMRAMEWMIKNEWGWMRLGQDGNAVAPDINGPYVDNLINSPRVTGDFNRDGSGESTDAFSPPWNVTPKTWYRAGIAAGVAAFRTAYPGVPVIGNIEFMGVANGGTDLPEYDQTFDGGTLEAVMGRASAYESWMDTATLVARIQTAEDMILDPMLGMVTGNPLNFSPTNYREMRHFLTFCMVTTNMTCGWTRNTQDWGDWDWYEEYDFNLGQATEVRRTSADQDTTWRRDFDNGIAIWCPRNVGGSPNTPGALALGGTFYALQGQASAWLTDGQAVTSVTCPTEHEGIILSRTPTAFAWEWVNPLHRNAANDDEYDYPYAVAA